MRMSTGVKRPSLPSLICAVIADHQADPWGELSGLTAPELGWVWRSRHGTALPMSTLYRASEDLLIKSLPRRRCVVSGAHLNPWVTHEAQQN